MEFTIEKCFDSAIDDGEDRCYSIREETNYDTLYTLEEAEARVETLKRIYSYDLSDIVFMDGNFNRIEISKDSLIEDYLEEEYKIDRTTKRQFIHYIVVKREEDLGNLEGVFEVFGLYTSSFEYDNDCSFPQIYKYQYADVWKLIGSLEDLKKKFEV